MKTVFIALALCSLSLPAFADGKASTAPDAQAVDSACSAEAQTAGCGSEQVGSGLLKCIHAYHQAHKKDFKLSPGCKAAMGKERADWKAKKASK